MTRRIDFTPRQLEVAKLAAEGASYKDIGKRLGMSHLTAKTHVTTIAHRLPDDGLPPLRRVMRWMLEHAA